MRSFIDTNVLVSADDRNEPARQSGCVQLLTENMNSGAALAGVRLVNPFA